MWKAELTVYGEPSLSLSLQRRIELKPVGPTLSFLCAVLQQWAFSPWPMPWKLKAWPNLTLLFPPSQNRGRLANKRTVTLPPTHALKKERTTSFSASDGDSDGSGPVCRQQPGLKQENDSHVHIMKRRYWFHGQAKKLMWG